MCGWGWGGGVVDLRMVWINEFKTNDLQDKVRTALHFGTVSNGTQRHSVIELLDEEEDPCSAEFMHY